MKRQFFNDTITIEATGIDTTDEGFLIIPARFTRAGIFVYGDVKQYRDPETVSNYKSIKTLEGKSLTDLHPPTDIFVDPDNWKAYEVGQVLTPYYDYDSDMLNGKVIVKDKNVINRILDLKEKGESIELSCGYSCILTTFESPQMYKGEEYTVEATDIVYNHVALVPKGRAGSNIKLMLDSITEKQNLGGNLMKIKTREKKVADKIYLDAMTIEVEDGKEKPIETMEKAIDSLCADLEIANVKLENVTKEKDELDAKVKELSEKKIDESEIEAIVEKKIELKGICDGLKIECENKIDSMEDAIVKKVMPKVNLEDKSVDYRKAIVDSSLELAKDMVKNNKDVVEKRLEDKGEEREKGVFESFSDGE